MAVRNTPSEYKKKPEPFLKPVKYLNFQSQGISKEEARDLAGYSPGTRPQEIENTKTYQNAREEIAGYIMPLPEIATELNKNIAQDGDKGAKNKAIQIALQVKKVLGEEAQGNEEIGDISITVKKT